MAYTHLAFSNIFLSLIFMAAVLQAVDGQIISTPCTGPMITSFTPCVNLLTNSSSNGTSPTEDCCSALRTMMTNGTNCLCLIVTGGIPFKMPMNPNLAMSLPQACNMPGVPLQCKAPSPPTVVAPGPLGDTGAPSASPSSAPISPSRNPKDSTVPPPSPSTSTPPAEEIPSLTPPSPPAGSSPSARNSGSQTPTAPSAAPSLGYGLSLLFLLTAFGAISLGLY